MLLDMLYLLDHFFTAFHLAFVVFVLTGWIYPSTRKAHITALLLTVIAWMLLGLYKGVIGYCPLTDWHWDIKRALGETALPGSFIEYVVEKITGINFATMLIDSITAGGLVFGGLMAFLNHWKEARLSKRKHHQTV